MVTAFIVFGSNIGDRALNINKAIGYFKETKGITVEEVSSIRETDPLGGQRQPRY